jgi:hypothetical protein
MEKSMFFVLVCSSFLIVGCDQIGEQAGKSIEQRVQQEANKLIDKALGSADKVLGSADKVLNGSDTKGKAKVVAEASAAGITPTLVNYQEKPARVASVYCTFDQTMDGIMEARFLNVDGAEIGRAKTKVRAKVGAGQFVDFPIDPRIPITDIATTSLRLP